MKKSIANNISHYLPSTSMKQGLLFVVVLMNLCPIVSENTLFGQTREGQQLVVAELLSDAVNTEKPFTVGIRFVIQPDWYLYWRNPGDAGLPIEVKWELPAGWKAEELRLPIPSKFVHDDITAFGYKNDVVLLATITPGSSKGPVKASVDWLVCRESCLRGETSVSLDVSNQPSDHRSNAAAVLARFRSRLPGTQKESGVLFQETRLSNNDRQWTINVQFNGAKAGEVRDFYPDIIEGIFPDFKSIVVDQGRLAMTFTLQDEGLRALSLRGLLVTTNSAYEIEIPIQLSSK